jgi:hypothetical protein
VDFAAKTPDGLIVGRLDQSARPEWEPQTIVRYRKRDMWAVWSVADKPQ